MDLGEAKLTGCGWSGAEAVGCGDDSSKLDLGLKVEAASDGATVDGDGTLGTVVTVETH